MAARELAAADAFLARCDDDPVLAAELDRRLSGPTTPLTAALAGWDQRPAEGTTLLEINAEHADRLGAILDAEGWPGLRTVGAEASDAAWLLAQHADGVNQVRRGWLPLLEAAVATGDADPRHLASLTDRVAAVDGRPQQFGTIVTLAADGEPEFGVPLHDPAGLEARRSDLGLPTIADEVAYLTDGEIVPYGPERGANPFAQWPMVLEGRVSVEAALEAGVRPIRGIWASRPGDRRLVRLRALARDRGVDIEAVEPSIIDELARGRTHGGVIALAGPRRTPSVHQLLAEVGERPLIVMLDGIEDPFNHGQAVRALYAAGVDGLVVRRSWETALATVTRASAGATELMSTATAVDPDAAADACRAAGMRIACAVADPGATELHRADLSGGLLLLIGGERRGVTRSFIDGADLLVRIGYGRRRAPELGSAAAAAVIGFEALGSGSRVPRRRGGPPAARRS